MPRIPDKCRLLHAPYRPPHLPVGDRADCNVRGTVVVTSWTDAKISWPHCLPVNSKGHPSLLLDDEFARVVGAWPDLPKASRHAVLALVDSARGWRGRRLGSFGGSGSMLCN